MITEELLRQLAPRCKNPAEHAVALEAARAASSVTTPLRLAHFLGQVLIETRGLVALVEDLAYKSPERLNSLFSRVKGLIDARALIEAGPEAIANRVYAERLGNGNEASGDGWRYRGSGYKQLTGRANYREFGKLLNLPLEEKPEMAREIPSAARIAFAFWDVKSCSTFADVSDCSRITACINGPARLALTERTAATATALKFLREA